MEPATRISNRPLELAAESSSAGPERSADAVLADVDMLPLDALASLRDAARAFTERLNATLSDDDGPRDTGEYPCGRYGANEAFRPTRPDERFEEGAADEETVPVIQEDPVVARRRGNGYDLKVRTSVSFRLAKFIDQYILRCGFPSEGEIASALVSHLEEPWSDATLRASRGERWTDEWREQFCQWWQRLLFHAMWSKELVARRPGGWITDSEAGWPFIRSEEDLSPRRMRDVLLWAFDGAGWLDPRRSFVDAVFPCRTEPASPEMGGAPLEADVKPTPKEPLETGLSEDARQVLAMIRRADPNGERALRLLWAIVPRRDQLRAMANRDSRRAQRLRPALPMPSDP